MMAVQVVIPYGRTPWCIAIVAQATSSSVSISVTLGTLCTMLAVTRNSPQMVRSPDFAHHLTLASSATLRSR